MKLLSLSILITINLTCLAQGWQWTELDTMPIRTSNNAVCEAFVNNESYVYSFGGIDLSKTYSGIHKRSFKYTVSSDTWEEIDNLPDAEPKIASGASYVNGKIYIIGGYHVYANGSEVSSNKLHIYDPVTDLFLPDGPSIPLAIDDHVQCVYNDSLIFVVTGWSNNGNKPNVQIYDTYLNQWQSGTPTPTGLYFTAFGASGYIIGDTLYYHGGAAGGSFAARKYMRKGYINPIDPTDITWTQMEDAPGDPGYRSACSGHENAVFWVGGSQTSYNYDGIAYNGTGGVNPSARILSFNNTHYNYSDEISQPYGVMDLRGIAKIGSNQWIICGGMDTNQVVSNRTFLLENNSLGLEDFKLSDYKVLDHDEYYEVQLSMKVEASLLDLNGRELKRYMNDNQFLISKNDLVAGVYLFKFGNSIIKLLVR